MVPRILRLLLDFWKIMDPCVNTPFTKVYEISSWVSYILLSLFVITAFFTEMINVLSLFMKIIWISLQRKWIIHQCQTELGGLLQMISLHELTNLHKSEWWLWWNKMTHFHLILNSGSNDTTQLNNCHAWSWFQCILEAEELAECSCTEDGSLPEVSLGNVFFSCMPSSFEGSHFSSGFDLVWFCGLQPVSVSSSSVCGLMRSCSLYSLYCLAACLSRYWKSGRPVTTMQMVLIKCVTQVPLAWTLGIQILMKAWKCFSLPP